MRQFTNFILAILWFSIIALLLSPFAANAQGIQYSSAVPHCNVTPVNAPSTFGSWLRYDKTNHILYRWNGTTWVDVSASFSLPDGDYGDITVSGGGLVWDIDTGVVGPNELASTAVTPGTYGSSTQVPQVTIDSDGRVTSAANVSISATAGASVITPATITATQNNYSPTGWASATTVRLSFDSDSDPITSFASGTSGERKVLRNVGAHYSYIPSEHPDGTAANRVAGDYDHIFPAGGSIVIEYDTTLSRWVVISNTFNPASNLRGHYYTVSAGSITEADYDALGFRANSGTHSTTTGAAGMPGVINLSTSSSATATASVYLSKAVLTPTTYGFAHLVFSTWVYLPVLSDAGQRYVAQMGFTATPNSTALDVNGTLGFRYSDNLNGGRWQGIVRDLSGAETVVDLGVTVSAVTLYSLTVCYDKNESEARFYINGAYSGRLTSGFPASATNCGVRTIIAKSVGTTERLLSFANLQFFTVY